MANKIIFMFGNKFKYLILKTKLIGVCSPSLSDESSLLIILKGLFGIYDKK